CAEHAGLREIDLAVAATFTIDPLLPYLGALLGARGLFAKMRTVQPAELHAALLDLASVLRAPSPAEVTVVLARLEDLAPVALRDLALLDRGGAPDSVPSGAHALGDLSARERALAGVDQFFAAIALFRSAAE